jgi:hypothetical protein
MITSLDEHRAGEMVLQVKLERKLVLTLRNIGLKLTEREYLLEKYVITLQMLYIRLGLIVVFMIICVVMMIMTIVKTIIKSVITFVIVCFYSSGLFHIELDLFLITKIPLPLIFNRIH